MTGLRDSQAHAIRESRDLMAAVTDQTSSGFGSHCIYCGRRAFGRACTSHKDLLLIEQQELAA